LSLDTVISSYVDATRRLIELERDAEINETARLQATLSAAELERRGLCILRLKIADGHTGLGARTLLDLEPSRDGDLPPGRVGPGDIVTLRSGRSQPSKSLPRDLVTGVVYRMTPRRVTVALDGAADVSLEEPVRLDKVANDTTYRRLLDVLDQLARYRGGPADRLRKVLFAEREPEFEEFETAGELGNLDSRLDESQKEAVAFAVNSRDVALIHGPPGTGKTTTLVEIIREVVERNCKVLACAPSNVAVDNLVERLVLRGLRVVRLGHPARLLPSVLDHSLDRLVEKAEGTKIVNEIRKELDQAHRRRRRAWKQSDRRESRHEIRQLAEELRELEKFTVRQILSSADVVLTTTVGAADSNIAGMDFDVVVLDEAAQALEASAWIPLLKARRAILAGDHHQLPPTIHSRDAERGGLGVTLFERLSNLYGNRVTRMLTVQYRMHERIMAWSSAELYGGEVQAHDSVRSHLLEDLPGCTSTPDTAIPLLLVDTAGCDLEEEEDRHSTSKANEGEANIVVAHVERLTQAGVRPEAVAVITPYNAQVRLLRRRLRPTFPDLEIGTVDGFQGREKDAIVISTVRSNRRGDVGFLADERRMNVAVTRARRHVAIVADSATVSNHPFLGRLVGYCQEQGEYRSAWEYR